MWKFGQRGVDNLKETAELLERQIIHATLPELGINPKDLWAKKARLVREICDRAISEAKNLMKEAAKANTFYGVDCKCLSGGEVKRACRLMTELELALFIIYACLQKTKLPEPIAAEGVEWIPR